MKQLVLQCRQRRPWAKVERRGPGYFHKQDVYQPAWLFSLGLPHHLQVLPPTLSLVLYVWDRLSFDSTLRTGLASRKDLVGGFD